jgi:hypothetical protein
MGLRPTREDLEDAAEEPTIRFVVDLHHREDERPIEVVASPAPTVPVTFSVAEQEAAERAGTGILGGRIMDIATDRVTLDD